MIVNFLKRKEKHLKEYKKQTNQIYNKRKRYYNKRRRNFAFTLNQEVYVYVRINRQKYGPRYYKNFKIIGVKNNNCYDVQHIYNHQILRNIHAEYIKPLNTRFWRGAMLYNWDLQNKQNY